MILLIVTEDSPQEAIVSFLKRAAYILVPLSLVLITDFPHIGIRYSTWDGQPAYAGAMTGKNSLALFSQLMALFFVWKLVCSRWYKESPRLDLTILAMTLYLLKKADSDAQWVCFLVGAFLLLTSRYERLAPRLRKAVVFVAIACVVLVASEAILGINNTLVEYLKGNATFAGRVELWRILRSVAPNVLFGAGYQSFWTPGRMSIIAADFPWTPTQAHNGYLEMFLNAGMVGLVCLFGLIISTFRKIEKTIQHGEQLGILLTCFVLSFVLTNLTEASVGKMSIAWFLLLLTSVFAFMKEAAWRAANPVWRIPARDARPHPLKPVKNLVRQNI
jgi:O-antigen ligase